MVRYSRPIGTTKRERRRNRRTSVPIGIVLEGRLYRTVNWSLGGFVVSNYAGNLAVDDDTELVLVVPYYSQLVQRPTGIKVTRVDRTLRELGAAFTRLDSSMFDALNRYFGRRIEAEDFLRRWPV